MRVVVHVANCILLRVGAAADDGVVIDERPDAVSVPLGKVRRRATVRRF